MKIFLLKKILTPFFLPLTLCLGTSIVGLILLWFTPLQQNGKILVTIGICMLCVLSSRHVAQTILKPLEKKYPSYNINDTIRFIVVLGGGYFFDPDIPITSRLSDRTLARLVEGIRIYRNHPGSKIIFTGKEASTPMADVAISIGINKDDIILENQSKDTKDEAKNVKALVNDDPFILVTSASHLPRAMALFKKNGMDPYPAPARHLIKGKEIFTPRSLLPGAFELYKSEVAFYEYLGILWAKIRRQI